MVTLLGAQWLRSCPGNWRPPNQGLPAAAWCLRDHEILRGPSQKARPRSEKGERPDCVGRRREQRVAAAVGHAIGFGAWRSLVREQGLDSAEAVDLMAAMVHAAGTQ